MKKNRILVDGIYLSKQMKGVGRYLANSLRELSELDTVNEYWILVSDAAELPPLPQNPCYHYVRIPLHNHFVHGYRVLPQQARRLKADLVWVPYETPVGFLPCPYFLVCHDVPDLIGQAQDDAGRPRSVARRLISTVDSVLIQHSLRHSANVFYNSHFVEKWLNDSVNVPEERLRYAPCAPGADFSQLSRGVDCKAVQRRFDCTDGYILVLGTGDQRENLTTALTVMRTLIDKGLKQNLVVAGVRENDRGNVQAQLDRFNLSSRARILPFYGEDQTRTLAEVYACADVYLDLSLHEGFGMQVIEAMACGTPVVCSDRGALPEVAGDAALLVDPTELSSIVGAVERITSDAGLRYTLVERGYSQSAQFTWHRTASAIYQRIGEL